jgi:uncharacterized protein YbjT (DUF2867 family)
MADSEGKIALLVGASGLVGAHLLSALLGASDFSRVHAVTRRALKVEHPRLANRIVQFERLEEQLKGMICHVAFCCLGTTLREAGSEQAQRRIDVGHVLTFARVARAAQAQRFVFLSCAGADPKSRRPDLRMKAEAEQALGALGFPSLDILQPGTLLGMRKAMGPQELVRLGTALLMSPFQFGAREPARGIAAATVAAAMLGAARSGRRGVYHYTYAGIQSLATSKPAPRPAPVDPVKARARQR